MKLNVAVVEDDKNSSDLICGYIKRYSEETGYFIKVDTYRDGDEITDEYRPEYDIIFLDIEMKRMDGMSAAKQIRKYDNDVILIFITNMTNLAIKGYEVEAFNYLLKPVTYFVFAREMSRSVEKLSSHKRHYLTLPAQNGFVKLEASEILYIERTKYKLLFKTKNGEYESKGTIKDMEAELTDGFFRCNNCYLVNMAHVKAIEGSLVLVGTDKLQISRPRKKEFMEALTAYLGGIKA